MLVQRETSASAVDRGVFFFEEAAAYLVESSTPTYDLCTDVCTENKRNFMGSALTVIQTSKLRRVDGDVRGFSITCTLKPPDVCTDMLAMHYCFQYLQVSWNLKMAIRAIRAQLNTTAGLNNYTVAVIGTPEEVSLITKVYEECGLHRHEVAFIHKEASKQGK